MSASTGSESDRSDGVLALVVLALVGGMLAIFDEHGGTKAMGAVLLVGGLVGGLVWSANDGI